MRRLPLACCAFAAALTVAAFPLAADEPAGEAPAEPAGVSYYRDVRPIFQEHCQGCHQPAKPLGGLVMTSHAELLKGGESEQPGVVPGSPDESQVLVQIAPQDGQPPAMPKDRPPLAAEQVELIRRWIAEGALDDTPPAERVAVDMAHPPAYTLPPVLTSLDFSPDGSLLAVSGYHEVLLHKVDATHVPEAPGSGGTEIVGRLVGLSERIESAVFSPDGKLLAVTGGSPGRFGEVQVWDVAERRLVWSLPVTFDTVYGASWSPDGTRIAFGCADNTLRAVDAATGQQVLYQGAHSDWVLDTVFSTDASHLISVSRDRSMKLTEVATQRFVDNITSITPGALKGGLIAVDRHPAKDELLVGGADGVPKIYKTYREMDRQIGDDFNLIRALAPLPGRIYDVQYSADGSRVVAGSSSDGSGAVHVYREADGALVWQAQGGLGPIYACTFSHDGKLVAAGGFDGLVRLFDAETGTPLRVFSAVPLAPEVAAAE